MFRGIRLSVLGVWIVLFVSACGFRLAGTAQLSPEIRSIHLVTADLNGVQRAQLIDHLERAGAAMSTAEGNHANILSVRLRKLPDSAQVNIASTGKRVLRLSRAIDYQLTTTSGDPLIATTTLSTSRDFTVDEDSLHASNREREEVIENLVQALFTQLVYRLQRL